MNALSKEAILVSCKQITAQPLELMALVRASCLASKFKPRMFQQRTFQLTDRTIIKGSESINKRLGRGRRWPRLLIRKESFLRELRSWDGAEGCANMLNHLDWSRRWCCSSCCGFSVVGDHDRGGRRHSPWLGLGFFAGRFRDRRHFETIVFVRASTPAQNNGTIWSHSLSMTPNRSRTRWNRQILCL